MAETSPSEDHTRPAARASGRRVAVRAAQCHLRSLVLAALATLACTTPQPSACGTDRECEPASRCVDRRCVPRDAGVATEAGADVLLADTPADAGDCLACGGACCRAGERCVANLCAVDLGPCASSDDCAGDSYCDATGRCTPYGIPSDVLLDPDCERPIEIGAFEPTEQCRWAGPPASDPFAEWVNVYSTPTVADFDLDSDATVVAPSIVLASFRSQEEGGVLRVFDGRTCGEVAALVAPEDRVLYAAQPAIGDLDGDAGRPEIVTTSLLTPGTPEPVRTPGVAGGLVAFGYDEASARFVRRWFGRRCDMPGEPRHMPNWYQNNNGPSLHDLDDDGVPEVLYNLYVYDADGCVLNPSQPYDNYQSLGYFAVAADVDLDGAPELVRHDGVYGWDRVARDWVREAYWAPLAADRDVVERRGEVAVADLGDFPGRLGDAPGRPEIVVVSAPVAPAVDGTVRVMTVGGSLVFGPITIPRDVISGRTVSNRGGTPTVGDFDGDGRREIGVAAGTRYYVFDLDCDIPSGSAPGCTRTRSEVRGVLWSQLSQDYSSSATGSSVFDFDADGVAEVVYRDECFLRIYRGTDGEVLFSAAAASGTGLEYPTIADVDGDFNSEIVVPMTAGSLGCPLTDPIFTRGVSSFARGSGFRVLRDTLDRWAASRPIWNQHAYAVTHVDDEGAVPRTSAWAPNFTDATLNNFRMNAQGTLELRGAADLTVAVASASDLCTLGAGSITLRARVCNRGTNPVADGARVVFHEGDESTPIACETALPRSLAPSMCADLGCDWTPPAGVTDGRGVTVVVDPDGEVFECRNGNNRGVVPASVCLM